MNSEKNVWEEVKQYYYERFGTAPELVDIAADYDILKMCASGSGTLSISKFLDADIQGISDILDTHFGFRPWLTDLPFSPLKIYKELLIKDLTLFKDSVAMVSDAYPVIETMENMYKACVLVEKLERLLDEKWI